MAFWGAPIDDPQHKENATKAILEMRVALEELNERLREEGLDESNLHGRHAVCEEWRVYVRYHAHETMRRLVRCIVHRHTIPVHSWGRSEAEARRVLRRVPVQQSGLTEM